MDNSTECVDDGRRFLPFYRNGAKKQLILVQYRSFDENDDENDTIDDSRKIA